MTDELKRCPFCGGEMREVDVRLWCENHDCDLYNVTIHIYTWTARQEECDRMREELYNRSALLSKMCVEVEHLNKIHPHAIKEVLEQWQRVFGLIDASKKALNNDGGEL